MAGKPVFRVGDHALYPLTNGEVEVEVIEDRGPIGFGGRRIVRVRVPGDYSEPYEVSIAEAYLRPVTDVA